MKKYNLLGMSVAFLTALAMILVSRLDAFRSSAYNPLMVGLLLFAFSMFGFGVSSLFYDTFKKKKKSLPRKHKEVNNDFIL